VVLPPLPSLLNAYFAAAATLSAIDYKVTMAKSYGSAEKERDAYSECHNRSAKRVLKALLANGGMIYFTDNHLMLKASIHISHRYLHQTWSAHGVSGCPPTRMDTNDGRFTR